MSKKKVIDWEDVHARLREKQLSLKSADERAKERDLYERAKEWITPILSNVDNFKVTLDGHLACDIAEDKDKGIYVDSIFEAAVDLGFTCEKQYCSFLHWVRVYAVARKEWEK